MHLSTVRLKIRDYQYEDWSRVHRYAADPEFSKYELWGPNTEEMSQNFVKSCVDQSKQNNRTRFDLAVCLLEDDLFIGGCTLSRESEESLVGSLGWAIDPRYQNQGFATEAANCLISHAFRKQNLLVLYATCDARNIASYRVMDKVGMRRVGLLKGNRKYKGETRDSLRYEIVNEDRIVQN